MTFQMNRFPSIFPDVPRESPVIDKKGDFTALWSLGLGALFQALQENFSSEGIKWPPLNSDNIDSIQDIYTPLIGSPLPVGVPDISGKTVFDTTNRIFRGFVITYDNASPPNIVTANWVTFTTF